MAIAKCALGIFLKGTFIRSIRGEADVQIVTAACLDLTDLEHHRISPSDLAVEGSADDVLLLLAREPHKIDGVARNPDRQLRIFVRVPHGVF